MIPPRDTSTDDHVGDLLPALINGTLDPETAMRVRGHLDRCTACREELTEWEAIATATQVFADRQQPTAPALDDVWAEIEPNTPHRPGNGTLSRSAQARAAVRQGITDSSWRDPALQSRRTTMSTTTLPTTRPRFALPAWTRHLHGVSTGLLIAVIVALSVAAWGLNGIGGNGGGDEPNGNFAAVPGSTGAANIASTPVTNMVGVACTVEPMTRDELIAHFQAANVATEPEYALYEQPREPSPEESEAIVQTYLEWQACVLMGNGGLQAMRFQSPWLTANTSGLFLDPSQSSTHRPISDEAIEAFVDGLFDEPIPTPEVAGQSEIQPYPTASAGDSAASSGAGYAQAGNLPGHPTPALAPASSDGTPGVSVRWSPMDPIISAEDIVITGPDTARVPGYTVDQRTGNVVQATKVTYTFVEVDGQWLLDSYTDEAG